jgi:hypothetical protein
MRVSFCGDYLAFPSEVARDMLLDIPFHVRNRRFELTTLADVTARYSTVKLKLRGALMFINLHRLTRPGVDWLATNGRHQESEQPAALVHACITVLGHGCSIAYPVRLGRFRSEDGLVLNTSVAADIAEVDAQNAAAWSAWHPPTLLRRTQPIQHLLVSLKAAVSANVSRLALLCGPNLLDYRSL